MTRLFGCFIAKRAPVKSQEPLPEIPVSDQSPMEEPPPREPPLMKAAPDKKVPVNGMKSIQKEYMR